MAARSSRRRRRKGRFGGLYKLLSAFLILAAMIAGCIVFFRVETVTVSGNGRYSEEEVIAASGVEQGDNLFLIPRVQTARKILQELPYIKEVSPRRVLPNAYTIIVTECTPAAIVEGQNGTWWVIDETCKLLEQGGEELKEQYAEISGFTVLMPSAGSKMSVPVDESGKLDALKQILAILQERDMLKHVDGIDLSREAEIRMEYDGRLTVRMPVYSDDFGRLLREVDQAVKTTLNNGQTGTINLTGSTHSFIPD